MTQSLAHRSGPTSLSVPLATPEPPLTSPRARNASDGRDPEDTSDPFAPARWRELVITARDGEPLAARLYQPPPDQLPVGAVLIAPAMAVPQTFYEALARFLSARGFTTLTFDYRGTFDSLRLAEPSRALRKVDTDLVRWAELDAAAALTTLKLRTPNLPITWLGHSLGGQILGLVPNAHLVTRVVTVASGNGYWRFNAPPLKRRVWLFWYGLVPTLTPLFGYFPGRRLGLVGDLPRGVIRQWRRWCLHPDYLLGELGDGARARFAELTAPITALSFSDDEMMSKRSIETLHALYTGARVEHRHLAPREVARKRVGHFGSFKADMEAPLWEPLLLPALATSRSV